MLGLKQKSSDDGGWGWGVVVCGWWDTGKIFDMTVLWFGFLKEKGRGRGRGREKGVSWGIGQLKMEKEGKGSLGVYKPPSPPPAISVLRNLNTVSSARSVWLKS